MTMAVEIAGLDCGNLTLKQREDLSSAFADDIMTSMGRAAINLLSSLAGEPSQVALTSMPVSASKDTCMVQGILSIPPGSTLQSMVREQNLVTLEGLLQDSTILANVEGDSLRVVQIMMNPMAVNVASTSLPRTLQTTTGGSQANVVGTTTLLPSSPSGSTSNQELVVPQKGKPKMRNTGSILLVTFLGLAACLCCVELSHLAWKCRGRRMMSRWLKTPVEAENSDSEDAGDTSGFSASSSENGEGAECAGTSTRTYL